MSIMVRRTSLAGMVLAAAVALTGLSAASASAGGPGTVYVSGTTHGSCEADLSSSIHSQQAHHQISGVQHCRKTGDGKRWFGSYVRN